MDGTFTINYVFPGTYGIVVTASSQTFQPPIVAAITLRMLLKSKLLQ
jgi:hypothetical protein